MTTRRKWLAQAALICLVVAGGARADSSGKETFEPGTGEFIVVLKDPRTDVTDPATGKKRAHEPDIARHGGKVLHKKERVRIVKLPVKAAKELRKEENVAYVQRVWLGEPLDDWDDDDNGSALESEPDPNDERLETDLTWSTGTYLYDGSGNIKQIGNDTYRYDSAGRLIRAVVGSDTESYKYDSFGNLVEKTLGTAVGSIPVDSASNRLQGEVYDAAGNLISNKGVAAYSYDSLSMMDALAKPAISRRMIYGPGDERIGVIQDTGLSRWKIRGIDGKVLREYQSDDPYPVWHWMEDYVYAEGRVVGAEREAYFGGKRHFHTDHLGTVRMITNQSRLRIALHDFYPFGVEKTDATQEYNLLTSAYGGGDFRSEPMQFTGHERDAHGLLNVDNDDYVDYMHARYYDPNGGRFLSVDPAMDPTRNIAAPQRWNRYAYALNNPLLRVDPDGRKDTIFIVNTTHGGGFTAAQLAALNRAVTGTRFEGNVRLVGPMASNGALLRTIRGADSTDMVGLIAHSGRSSFHSDGNIFTQKKLDAAALGGGLQGGLTGADLTAAVNPNSAVGVCMLAGCSSDQAATSIMTGAGVLTFGTTNHTRLDQVGNALVSTFGALAHGASPAAAAANGSQQLTLKPDCSPSNDCDPTRPAQVQAAVPPQ